jgi:xanthine dehydrogenase accessory factor
VELKNDASRTTATRHVVELESLPTAVELLVEIYPPPPTLIMIGGVHISVVLTTLANDLGYHTIVIDPRSAFGTQGRFSHADQLMSIWPQDAFSDLTINSSTAIAMLTHDPKIDDPALHAALESDAFYIGALGSKRSQENRRHRLRDAGYSEDQLTRIHGPIGLPLGGRNPDEIALAIMAQIVAARNKTI